MLKRFCDRCKKETDKNKMKTIKISCGHTGMYSIYREVTMELCEECQKQSGVFEFLEENRSSQEITEETEQDKFLNMFREFIRCMVEDSLSGQQ